MSTHRECHCVFAHDVRASQYEASFKEVTKLLESNGINLDLHSLKVCLLNEPGTLSHNQVSQDRV